jgi:membrane associated rhomboid family serine protease
MQDEPHNETSTIDVEPDEPPVREHPPLAVYTYILLVGIGAVFLAQMIVGQGLTSLLVGDNYSALVAGFYKPLFTKHHEYWRILTGATIHGGLIHVLMNGYALLLFGRLVEMLSNRAHLAIVFLLACIGGGLLSLYFIPDGVSVGASGGIVGLLGYVTVYAFRRRKFISAEFRKSLLINIGFLFFFGLVLINVVDNYGHLGGLIVGGVYGLIQIPSDEYKDPRIAHPITRIAGVIALGVFLLACVLSIALLIANRGLVVPEV